MEPHNFRFAVGTSQGLGYVAAQDCGKLLQRSALLKLPIGGKFGSLLPEKSR